MCRKIAKNGYFLLLLLSVFCLSFPAPGGQLRYGEEVEYGHHNIHTHGQRLGEEAHDYEHFTVSYDFLTIKPSSSIKACPGINSYLHTNYYPEYYRNFSEISSVHYLSINRFYPPYQVPLELLSRMQNYTRG